MKPSTASLQFTKAELAQIKRRQRESAKLIARLAATETLEQQQQLANELCPRFDDWIRGRNRIQSTPTRRPRAVANITPRARAREHRPAGSRRASSSSSTSSQDPGSDSDPEPPAVDLWQRRWASDTAWLNFVRSVQSRDFERELHLERMRGVSR